jgi:S-adenosylmethionine-dependent methyltransferase
METRLAAAFDAGAAAYADYLTQPAGRLRHEIVWSGLRDALAAHFGTGRRDLTTLDAGAGTGAMAVRLLEAGHRVWLAELSPAMLARARAEIDPLGAAAAGRATLIEAAIEDLPPRLDGRRFDLVLCHTVLEFVPEPAALLATLAGMLAPGGLLSLTALNRAALPLHLAAVRRDWSAARAALERDEGHDAMFGLRRVAFAADALWAMLTGLGLRPVAEEGVRVLDNLLPAAVAADPAAFAAVLDLELALRTRSPYREIGRYLHLIARRPLDA